MYFRHMRGLSLIDIDGSRPDESFIGLSSKRCCRLTDRLGELHADRDGRNHVYILIFAWRRFHDALDCPLFLFF